MRAILFTLLALCITAGALPAQNLLQNPGFQEADGEIPRAWQWTDWGTGGATALARDAGGQYAVVRAANAKQRACWRQRVPFTGKLAVFEARMRSHDTAAINGRGAGVRLCFRDEQREIALQSVFFPPAAQWTKVRAAFLVPAGTRSLYVELLHWFVPGETHWDDVSLRSGSEKEMAEFFKQNLDPKPGPTQKPYYPADNQVVAVTPPPFIWVPAGSGAAYSLQVSSAPDFPKEKTHTYRGLRRAVFAPRETFPAGKWYWRYGIETNEGVVYGRTRPFIIAATARPFPFPDFDAVVQRVPQAHPRLFFPGEQLARVRAAAQGELKPVVDNLVRSCEKEIGGELIPEPSYPPKEWAQFGPWASKVIGATRPPMDVMERCALAYLLTGDRRLGLEAKRRLLYFFSWDPEGATSFFTYDEPPMWVMMRGSRAYDWTYDLFTAEERARIEPNMKKRALQFFKKLREMPFESNPYESHAGRLPGFLGECAINFIHEWPEAREWLEYVTLIYYTSYPAWGGEDGGWQEGPGYWSAYMNFALTYVTALRQATGVDLMQKPFFRNTPYYALYTATPYHEHAPFGDGQEGRPRGLGSILYPFSTLLHDPYLRWYSVEAGFRPGADVLSLANYDGALQPASPLTLPQARVFPGAGLASIHTALGNRDEDISFLLRSSPYGSVSHGHADQNAFALEAFGKGLAIATGYYPYYDSPHHQEWTRATQAVNSILVDGEGQVRRSYEARGAITAFEHGDQYDYVEGEAAPAYGGRLTRFRRHVLHIRPGVFVIFDDLAAVKPSTFQWLLHAYDKIGVDETNHLLHIERAPAAMDVHLLLPGTLTFTQTDRYTVAPEYKDYRNTWHLQASATQPAKTGQFLAVLLPYHLGKESAIPKVELVQGTGAVGARLTFPDGTEELVAFRTATGAGEAHCAGLRSDGRVFARGRDKNGRLQRRFLLEGSRLSENGKPLSAAK